jgi:hypothetical protein
MYESLAQEWKENSSWMAKYEVKWDPSSWSLKIHGPSLKGKLQCGEGEMEIHLELGWMLRVFESEIDAKITAWIEKIFGAKC